VRAAVLIPMVWRFAAHPSGLASGLALAVRPAGAAEVSGVKGGPICGPSRQRRAAGAPLRPEGPPRTMCGVPALVTVTFRPMIGAPDASVTAWSCSCGAVPGPLRRGSVAAGGGGSHVRQPPRP
jgi:hypothetical protein